VVYSPFPEPGPREPHQPAGEQKRERPPLSTLILRIEPHLGDTFTHQVIGDSLVFGGKPIPQPASWDSQGATI
jgi:hypothetical protein